MFSGSTSGGFQSGPTTGRIDVIPEVYHQIRNVILWQPAVGYDIYSTVVGQAFSSVNTRSGDLCVFTAKNLDGHARQAGRAFFHMVAETIVEIGESGVQVYD